MSATPLTFDIAAYESNITLESNAEISVSSLAEYSGPRAFFFVKTTDMRHTFQYQVDSEDIEHVVHNGTDDIRYIINTEKWLDPSVGDPPSSYNKVNTGLIMLNAANAMMHQNIVGKYNNLVTENDGSFGDQLTTIVYNTDKLFGTQTTDTTVTSHDYESANNKSARTLPIIDSSINSPLVKFADAKMLLKHDFMRRMSVRLFSSPHFVDLFNNENTVLEDLTSKLSESYHTQIYKKMKDAPYTNDNHEILDYDSESNPQWTNTATKLEYPEDNICREIMLRMLGADIKRFNGDSNEDLDDGTKGYVNGVLTTLIDANEDGTGTIDADKIRPLPFIDGDSIEFKVIINEKSDQLSAIYKDDGYVDGTNVPSNIPRGQQSWTYIIHVKCMPDSFFENDIDGSFKNPNTTPTDKKSNDTADGASYYNTHIPYGGSS